MSQNVPAFRWSTERQQAALDVAEDKLNDEEIAKRADVDRRQLTRWKQHPDFAARVEEHRARWRELLAAEGLANQKNRVEAYNDIWRRLQTIIAERADDPAMAGVPGGKTGLLVKTKKGIGGGDNWQSVDEVALDTGLLKEFRELAKQMAQDLGQWTEKKEHSGAVTIVREYVDE